MLQRVLKKWPIVIRDDRGKNVPLSPPVKYDRNDFGGFLRSKYIGNHAGHAADSKAMQSAGAIYGAVMGGTMFATQAAAQFALRAYTGIGKQWIVPIIAGMLAWPFFPFFVRYVRQKRAPELRAAYIKARHCASCDYDMSNLPVEQDGCSKCPECDAAWKLEPARLPFSTDSQTRVEEFAKRFVKEMEGIR